MRRGFALLLGLVAMAASSPARAQAPEPLRVFAAASLAEPFQALAAEWEGAPIQTNLAASSALVVQIQEGAPADVIATADQQTMQKLVDAKLVETPSLFARNRLVVAVEQGNPKRVTKLADLARSDLIVVLAAPEVPAGRYARQLLDAAGVTVAPRSLEENVKAVLTKVSLGEADAGVVYASDVRAAAGQVEAIAVPEAETVEVTYWIAPLVAAKSRAAAKDWIALVLSPAGRSELEKAGFRTP
jgi:molybdate transport system substrate-binding protein